MQSLENCYTTSEHEDRSAPKASAEVQSKAVHTAARNHKGALVDRKVTARPASNMNPKKDEANITAAAPSSARPAPQSTVSSATFEVFLSPEEHELKSILSASATLNRHPPYHTQQKRVDTKDGASASSFLLKNGLLVPISEDTLSILFALAAQSYGETTVLNAIDAQSVAYDHSVQ